MIELVTKLEEFSLKALDLTMGKAVRLALKQASELAGHHPVILQLQKTICPFALDILKSQVALCMNYTVKDSSESVLQYSPSGPGQYLVEHNILLNISVSNRITDQRSDDIQSELIACDLGISSINSEKPLTRITSNNSCTCLFTNCWGLPCRHILRLYLHEQWNLLSEDIVSSKWLIKTERQKTTFLNQLYMNRYQPKTNSLNVVDKDDRYGILTSEFKEIAHLGSLSDENFEKVRCNLRN